MIDTTGLKELYVVGRPRSGTVWLNLLLADALDSPLQVRSPNAEAPAYFGPGRDGGFVVRKAHGDEKFGPTVFIQRDPRDVAISTMFFREQTDLFPVVQQMCEPYQNSYERHIRLWLDYRITNRAEFYTRYELLHENAVAQLRLIVLTLAGKTIETKTLQAVVERQSFAKVRENDTEGRFSHSMHKGLVGSWKNYFTPEIGQYMQKHMGNFMIEEGYVQERHWWKELPDKSLVNAGGKNE